MASPEKAGGLPPVGARVRWRSQAGGYWKEKEGRVVYSGPEFFILGPPENDERLPEEVRKGSRQFDNNIQGLIVAVDVIRDLNGDGKVAFTLKKRKPAYYAPAPKGVLVVQGANS